MGYFTPMVECLKYITVEPVIFLFFWAIPYIDHANGVLLFNKFCLEDYHNITYCDLISHNKDLYKQENIEIQSQTSR